MTKAKSQVRYDAANQNRCGCGKCGKSLGTLAPARPASLREVGEAVYVHRVLDALTPAQRKEMIEAVAKLDGDRIDASKSDLYVAGIYLSALSRAPQSTAMKPTTTKQTTPKQSAEADARDKLRRDSASAWRKK